MSDTITWFDSAVWLPWPRVTLTFLFQQEPHICNFLQGSFAANPVFDVAGGYAVGSHGIPKKEIIDFMSSK